MMCPPSPSGVRLLFFDMTWVPVGFPIGSVTSYDELWMSQSVSLEDPVETLSYNSRPYVLGSLIRSLFCYSVFSLCGPWCFSSWVQLFALPCVALHVTLYSWWLPCNIPAPFPVNSFTHLVYSRLHHELPINLATSKPRVPHRDPVNSSHVPRAFTSGFQTFTVTPCFSCAFPRTLVCHS